MIISCSGLSWSNYSVVFVGTPLTTTVGKKTQKFVGNYESHMLEDD